jgi:hypothetical protein
MNAITCCWAPAPIDNIDHRRHAEDHAEHRR